MTGKSMEMLWLVLGFVELLVGIVAVAADIDSRVTAFGIILVVMSVYCDMQARYHHEDHKDD